MTMESTKEKREGRDIVKKKRKADFERNINQSDNLQIIS